VGYNYTLSGGFRTLDGSRTVRWSPDTSELGLKACYYSVQGHEAIPTPASDVYSFAATALVRTFAASGIYLSYHSLLTTGARNRKGTFQSVSPGSSRRDSKNEE
jgi:hypothetical protein